MDTQLALEGRAPCGVVEPAIAVLVAAAALMGGAAQSILGFGAAFTLVPVLAVVAPELLPGAPIVAFLPLSALMAWRERRSLDRPAAARLVAARVPGTLVGTAAVALMPVHWLAACVAVLLLVAVAASARGWTVAQSRRNEAVAGAVSGFSGTAVGLGGPPLALLYRGRHSAELRPTLAAVFVLGICLSLMALGVSGGVQAGDIRAGAALAGMNVLGLVAAAPVLRRMPEETIRAGLLVWAGVGAVLALVRVMLG